jgi:hypothetical protein
MKIQAALEKEIKQQMVKQAITNCDQFFVALFN